MNKRATRRVKQQSTQYRLPRLAAAALMLATLGGCASQIAQLPIIGLPANTPTRQDGPAVYPAVHDVPPPREQALLEPEERTRLQNELVAARDQQAREAPDGGRAVKAAADAKAAKSAKKKTTQDN